MKILILTNLYPPHHAGTNDHRCRAIAENLKKRGHQIKVLASTHGLHGEQRDAEIERRLLLNGAFGHDEAKTLKQTEQIDRHNHEVLREALGSFRPELVYVWSLIGVTKSLVFTIRRERYPLVFDVADRWITQDLPRDRYLRYWNQSPVGFAHGCGRFFSELFGGRNRRDAVAPTRLTKGYDRQPVIFAPEPGFTNIVPNSVNGWPFASVYFCSELIKAEVLATGLPVANAPVIHPGLPSDQFFGEAKPVDQPIAKALIVSPLHEQSGVFTALQAMVKLREAGIRFALTVCGRGDSAYVAETRSMAVRNNLPVTFLQLTDEMKDLPKAYREHDLFLYPSEFAETYATTPLQAMACGVPVVGATIGAAREIFQMGEFAKVFAPGDVDDMVRAVTELVQDPDSRCAMVESAQARVLGQFNESAVTDKIEAHINSSLEMWSMQ